ncbi:MAG: hypothetical protein R3D55_29675 [Chloroflexota bacterium]
MHNKKPVILLLLLFLLIGCSGRTAEERRAYATWEAEQYPWVYYPISEESKQELCEVLELPEWSVLCSEYTKVLHRDVLDEVQRRFPVDKTSYSEIEAVLGDFPHEVEESRQPNGNLVGLRYVYRLTEYEGACIHFYVNADDLQTVERIGSTGLGTGPSPTRCGPAEE